MVITLQETAVLTLNIFERIAGHRLKRGIHVHQRQIGQLRIGYADAAGDRPKDASIETELFESRLAFDNAMSLVQDCRLHLSRFLTGMQKLPGSRTAQRRPVWRYCKAPIVGIWPQEWQQRWRLHFAPAKV